MRSTAVQLRRLSPFFIAIVALSLVVTLPAAHDSSVAAGDDEPVQIDPEDVFMAYIEVEDQTTLSLLGSQGIDLDHWVEPTDRGTVLSMAIVTESELDVLGAMGATVLDVDELPDVEELASQRMGNVDGFEVLEQARENQGVGRRAAGKESPIDEVGPLRVLRADTFTNYAGDFLSVEVRSASGSAANRVFVDPPSSAAGTYPATGANFGPSLLDEAFSGPFAVVDDGTDDPTLGCEELIDFPSGAIALADRGECPFVDKVLNAQAAGAIATVIINNTTAAPINLGGTSGAVTIPSGMISLSDGNTIKDGLPASGTFEGAGLEARFEIDGEEYSLALTPFTDAGQYIYHRTARSRLVPGIPEEITIVSGGTQVTVPTEPWASYDEIGYPEGFQWGFITTGYPDAVDSTDKIEELAAEFPDLAEIIELPYESHGYRREAMLTFGTTTSNAVVVKSQVYGHEGGNDLTFAVVNPGEPDSPLEVTVDGNDITVSQSTSAAGNATGTAAQIVNLINNDPVASEVLYVHTYRGNAGNGVTPYGGPSALSDFLNAPEDKISREPATVKVIRIGKHRDGSRVGVWAYSQEHAREWVTPLVALESAERLLRNYGTDPDTTKFVDDLDIFIIPTVNPDGTNYSLYDFAAQRRNMNNYCVDDDPARRNQWGVDLNRNFRVGTLWDGYSGASTNCRSDVFAGPEPLSETEIQNEIWLVDNHPNIRFSMNIHTHGGYFMWAPGAYSMPGRVPLERPTVGIEEYFFEASHTILGKIAEHRGTVVEPGRTGPIIDVLYSAAGNSADDVWYKSLERGTPIYAWNFEAGANLYTGAGGSGWQSPGGFFPNFAAEGFDQGMEFASGVYGLLEVAHQFAHDTTPPTSTPNVDNGGWYQGSVDVVFETSEPADIYYTTDGSRPTFDSPVVDRRDARDSAAPVRIDETTTLRWFAVDAAGNIEGGYDPDGEGHNYQRVHIRIQD